VSRKSAIIFGQGTIPEPSTPHIGREVAEPLSGKGARKDKHAYIDVLQIAR
jgi:hypothetical protein